MPYYIKQELHAERVCLSWTTELRESLPFLQSTKAISGNLHTHSLIIWRVHRPRNNRGKLLGDQHPRERPGIQWEKHFTCFVISFFYDRKHLLLHILIFKELHIGSSWKFGGNEENTVRRWSVFSEREYSSWIGTGCRRPLSSGVGKPQWIWVK